MSAPVVPGYAESGDSTERNEDTTQNKITRDPSDTTAEERQTAEQSKIARLGVHSRFRLERGSDTLHPSARVDGLEPLSLLSPRADGTPSFWERPSHALPDRKRTAAERCQVGQGRLALSTVGKKFLH